MKNINFQQIFGGVLQQVAHKQKEGFQAMERREHF